MIPTDNLKNKNFSRSVRGYNPIEVDDYIKFLLTKYEQLHEENADLEKRLHIVSGKYEELVNEEEAIRNAVAQAQKLSESMIRSAEKSANDIIDKVNKRCEDIIEDAQIKVEAEQKKLADLRFSAAQFKEMLIREYTKYLKNLRETEIPSVDEVKAEFPTLDAIRKAAMESLIPDEIIERAVVSTANDPELVGFKRFVRHGQKRLSPEEKSSRKEERENGVRSVGDLTDEILQSNVDDELPGETKNDEDLLAAAHEMSVEDALSSTVDTDISYAKTDSQLSENGEVIP